VEESAKEAESDEVAKGSAHAEERPMSPAHLEDQAAAEEKVELEGVANLVPPWSVDTESTAPS
jgi:hypothetical protein